MERDVQILAAHVFCKPRSMRFINLLSASTGEGRPLIYLKDQIISSAAKRGESVSNLIVKELCPNTQMFPRESIHPGLSPEILQILSFKLYIYQTRFPIPTDDQPSASATMGRYQQWNHNTNLDNLIWKDRNHPPSERHHEPRSDFQPPRGPRYNHERSNTEFERRQNPRNKPRNDFHHGNANRPHPMNIARCVDPGFIMRTRRLKEYLTRSLNAALIQIERWYPEDGGDEMDWQHEATILVNQPQEPIRVWAETSQSAEVISPPVVEDCALVD
ncbi:hypothetical protein VTL71DRAFT_8405 [Oculimacula yallundae]|uniref:Uncharacterized protein n=1 Tax=Oculimacula yallundae TaxID=86028 RepID=A0ABR4CYI4_9HELO